MASYIPKSRRDRLLSGLRRDGSYSVLDPDIRPEDLLEIEESQARPSATSYGPDFPIGPTDVSTISGVETLEKQLYLDIRSLLLTSPGECISDKDFGVGLNQLIFESQFDTSVDRFAIDQIKSQMETYYPAVQISRLEVFTVDNVKKIELVVSLGGTSVSVTI
tara:strand:+ start:457 stop:945 length:489 start_codon:yes stop_codon:yes gene_type:complete